MAPRSNFVPNAPPTAVFAFERFDIRALRPPDDIKRAPTAVRSIRGRDHDMKFRVPDHAIITWMKPGRR
jgi:hypothetical protein